ncbi:MAG: S41 family peptidase [Alphaproteobacteria bacterium]|nr:S41 family peptidase [Alphaproteobacteria bacterium]
MSFLKARTHFLNHIFAALALFLLAACAQASLSPNAEYSDSDSQDMFVTGFGFISNRYIKPVSLREMSVGGLNGLRQIDSKLDVRDRAGRIEILYKKQLVGSVSEPINDDFKAWTDATVKAIALAREVSQVVHGARAEAIFEAIFDNVLKPLDRFSRYDDAETATEKRAFRDGFGGIGVTIQIEDVDALIISVNKNGPAAKAGVQAKDRMTHINGDPISGWTQSDLVKQLRGRINTSVRFTLKRPGRADPIAVLLNRAHVVPETAQIRREEGVAVVRLSGFNVESARRLELLVEREMISEIGPPKGFVLDLRSNPGGRLDVSIGVSDIFLDGGAISTTRGRHPGSHQVYSAKKGDVAKKLPVVVLINGNSASAAEIVTAALQDNGRAIVIGTNSFGKGTVQSVLRLPNNGEITLTWSRLLAPSGYRLHELGILPSVCTHGRGNTKSAKTLVSNLQNGRDVLAGRLNTWRATGDTDTVNREKLREICPSDSGKPNVDLALAKAIIADAKLYRSLLHEAKTTVAQR